jgi:hypothetical protein
LHIRTVLVGANVLSADASRVKKTPIVTATDTTSTMASSLIFQAPFGR